MLLYVCVQILYNIIYIYTLSFFMGYFDTQLMLALMWKVGRRERRRREGEGEKEDDRAQE